MGTISFYVAHISNVGWFMLLPDLEKVKYFYSKGMIKCFAEFIENLYFARRDIIYKPKA